MAQPTEREVTITLPESLAQRLATLLLALPSGDGEPLDEVFYELNVPVGAGPPLPYRIERTDL